MYDLQDSPDGADRQKVAGRHDRSRMAARRRARGRQRAHRPARVIAVLAALVGACTPAPSRPAGPAPPAAEDPAARLATLVPRLMADAAIPGLSIALIRDDQIVWQGAFGVANAEIRRPVTATTMFQAASLSKPVFAYAVLKLAAAGRLDLDRPLVEYLHGGYDGVTDPRLAQITARHVLTHTTGFPNWRTGALAIGLNPGTQFSYSGEGFVYLARVVEQITGESFGAFMQRSVLAPLGMTHSQFGAPDDAAAISDPHDARGALAMPRGHIPHDRDPAAGLYTTAEDYAKFAIAVARGTGLPAALHAQMLAPQVPVIAGGPMSIERPQPTPLRELAWGLGWGVQTTSAGSAFWHWGDNGNSMAFVVSLAPAAAARPRVAVVWLANSANGLSIARALVPAAIGVAQPGADWLDYEPYDAPGRARSTGSP